MDLIGKRSENHANPDPKNHLNKKTYKMGIENHRKRMSHSR